jgi:Carboxypeptidase regulatory-like domain
MCCRLALGGLFCFLLLWAQDKPPATCTVSGVVVDSVTGQALAKAQVRLQRMPRDRSDAGTVTNAAGKFSMAGLVPGQYRLYGLRNGYQPMYLGARRAGSGGTTLTLNDGQQLSGLKLALQPYAVIAGTVRDSDGEPLVGTSVQAFRWGFMGNKRKLLPDGYVRTDDLGQYRLADVRPGKYLLRADPRISTDFDDRTAGASKRPEFDAVTYHPGTADWSSAVPVEVAAGGRIAGIDITVRRSRLFRVMGRVTLAQGVQGMAERVYLNEVRAQALFGVPEQSAGVSSGGSFLLLNVPPGSYRLRALNQREQVGSAIIEVRDADIENVEIVLRPGTEVIGTLRPEGESKEPLDNWVAIFDGPENSFVGRPKYPERVFTVSLAAGHYTIQLSRGMTLSHAWLNGTDILADGLTVGDTGRIQLDLVASVETGQIAGNVVNASGEPPAGATVVLVPEAKLRDQTQRFDNVSTDQYGNFLLKDVAPGAYKVFAWDDVEEGMWFDPDFLKKFEKFGEPVTVKAKQAERVKITLRPAAAVDVP